MIAISITTIIFDFGGVIIASDGSTTEQFISESLNVPLETVQTHFWKEVTPLQKGEITEEAFWKIFASKVNRKIPEDFPGHWLSFYLAHNHLDRRMVALVKELKSKGYLIPLLSNTIESHANANRTKGFYEFFDPVILSHEVKMRKPDAEIYQLVLERTGRKAEECLYVDDSQQYVEGAEAVSIRAIKFSDVMTLKEQLRHLGIAVE